MTLDMNKIGTCLQLRRKLTGLTQAQLGQRLHVTAQSVSNWARGVTLAPLVHNINKENKPIKLIICAFHMDSGCAELRFDDGTTLDINCTAIEHRYGHTIQ